MCVSISCALALLRPFSPISLVHIVPCTTTSSTFTFWFTEKPQFQDDSELSDTESSGSKTPLELPKGSQPAQNIYKLVQDGCQCIVPELMLSLGVQPPWSNIETLVLHRHSLSCLQHVVEVVKWPLSSSALRGGPL